MPQTSALELRASAQEMLAALAGPHARLREDQWVAIHALVAERRRALVVQKTGWGKSAVYFLAAKLLRATGSGPTVIVSPLLALMRNQVAAAARAGVVAATINSGNITEWQSIHEKVAAGELDVLLVSPERLNNPDFRDNVLPHLAADAGMVVVDEAHCVSDWGHDFRPDYRRIRSLLREVRPGTPVLATTATANDRVVTDIAEQLGVGTDGETLILRGPLDRDSLHLSVLDLGTGSNRAAWLAEHLRELPGSGIIYALTVSAAEDLASLLREHGYDVTAYTGKTDAAERELLEAELLDNKVKALVATSALGMGFDKPDLGFVVHVGAPSSPIAYYQQVGRAGRAADKAEVVLLPGPEDKDIWRYFASVAFPGEAVVRKVLGVLDGERPQSTQALEPLVDLSRTRLELVLKVLDVDGAVRRVKGGWVATDMPWEYDNARYERLDAARAAEQQAMVEYTSTSMCRMEFLRRQLDDPLLGDAPAPCGRCDNCTGSRFSPDISTETAASTAQRLSRPGIVLAPRRQWPSGLSKLGVPLSGKISLQADPGRAIGRLSDLGWGQRLRKLFERPDGPIPMELFQASIDVLKAWDWKQRPRAVLALESPQHPVLAASLAQRLAEVGKLADLGVMRLRTDHPSITAQNSAYRVAGLYDAWQLPESLPAGPILLVDTLTDTGWTFAMAAHMLRGAGADAVLPFAIAATN